MMSIILLIRSCKIEEKKMDREPRKSIDFLFNKIEAVKPKCNVISETFYRDLN